MRLWKFGREDIAPALLLAILPFVLALPQLTGWIKSDPMMYTASITHGFAGGILRGMPHIDPNAGYTAQALGHRAALDWLQGDVPWWNFHSGVGLPLAAEYQPAVFFPPTLLLLLPHGMAWQMLLLQMLSGWGAYGLLRQTGSGRAGATAGGVLYAFNGTLAWLSNGPATVLPFLPFLLWGIERAYVKTALRERGGWRLLALAMGLGLLAGFPETAYINGILALAWALLRGFQTRGELRAGYALRIVLGGAVGIALAAPQVLAFFQFLPHAFVGGHGGGFAQLGLLPETVIPSLIAPYAFGPIFGYDTQWPLLTHVWGRIGGYVSVAMVVLAAYGFAASRGALRWLLLAWIVLALGKTFALEPAQTLWNLVPGITLTAFFRYAQPSWELAVVILAAWGVDAAASAGSGRRAAFATALIVACIAIGGGLIYGARLWPNLAAHVGLRNAALASAFWAAATVLACILLLRAGSPRRAQAIAILIAVDSILLFAVPMLSAPRAGAIDLRGVEFLRANLGLQRFFTLGPIQPNYGAYFGIASINYNYLPVSERWVSWVGRHLAPALGEAAAMDGRHPSAAKDLRENLVAYQWLGVRYVVAPRNDDPFASNMPLPAQPVRKVHTDEVLAIWELPEPKPYFEALGAQCSVRGHSRLSALVDCDAAATLVRRELFFPGWTATVNAADARIGEHAGLFQAIALPKGKSEVLFRYAPPHIAWAWLAALTAAITLAFASVAARRPKRMEAA